LNSKKELISFCVNPTVKHFLGIVNSAPNCVTLSPEQWVIAGDGEKLAASQAADFLRISPTLEQAAVA
jgi:hypothetical protein